VETFLKHCVHRILELISDTCPLWDLEEIYKLLWAAVTLWDAFVRDQGVNGYRVLGTFAEE